MKLPNELKFSMVVGLVVADWRIGDGPRRSCLIVRPLRLKLVSPSIDATGSFPKTSRQRKSDKLE